MSVDIKIIEYLIEETKIDMLNDLDSLENNVLTEKEYFLVIDNVNYYINKLQDKLESECK